MHSFKIRESNEANMVQKFSPDFLFFFERNLDHAFDFFQ